MFQMQRLSCQTSLEKEAAAVIDSVIKKWDVFREVPALGKYIFDFFVPNLGLVIEADGPSHDSDEAIKADGLRDADCTKAGLRVVRLSHRDLANWNQILSDAVSQCPEIVLKKKKKSRKQMDRSEAFKLLSDRRSLISKGATQCVCCLGAGYILEKGD